MGGIGHSENCATKLADPEVRRQIVPLIFQARNKDAGAATHIEQALARLQQDSIWLLPGAP